MEYVDTSIVGQCRIIVEGKDDQHVIRQILSKCFDRRPDIREAEGIDKLIQNIPNYLQQDRNGPLGIVVDANGSLARCWERIRSRFTEARRPLPKRPDPRGTIVFGDRRRGGAGRPDVGVWIMPDNQSEGELEDFVRKMIPADDNLWPRAKDYIARIDEAERRFAPKKTVRAQVHAWLAATEKPSPMGLAVKKGELVIDGELCKRFVDWVVRLQEVSSNGLNRN